MDDVDITAARAEREEKYLLAATLRPSGPTPNGECHYCGEMVGDEDRWCSPEHRDLWQREASLRNVRGRR